MLTDSQQTLLRLIRIALGNETDFVSPIEADLSSIIALSKKQGVSSIACDGLALFYEKAETDDQALQALASFATKESEQLKFLWLGETVKSAIGYNRYVKCLAKLAKLFADSGLQMMVLKGYGLSLNYPIPSHRPTGDIDVYLFGEAERGSKVLKEQAGVESHPAEHHHTVFDFEQYVVENHVTILNIRKHPSSQYLEKLLEELAKEATMHELSGVPLYIPSAKFNSVHLLRHMASDFATISTSLRHVLDWSTFVHKNRGSIDWDFLRDVAHRSNMHRFLDAINSICVDYLGYPSEEYPIENRDDKLRNKVLQEIFSPAFQEEIPSRDNLLAYGWVKTKRLWCNRWKYQIVYKESLLQTLYNTIYNRILTIRESKGR